MRKPYLSKIYPDLPALLEQVKAWKAAGKKIVFTNGCFDIIHPGHIDYLEKAADMGDVLIIGVNTDASVSKLKGPHRPIQSETARLRVLAGLSATTALILFDEGTPKDLIKAVLPDILVKGGDYTVTDIVGYREVTENGGQVTTIAFLPGYSTSAIEQKIKAG